MGKKVHALGNKRDHSEGKQAAAQLTNKQSLSIDTTMPQLLVPSGLGDVYWILQKVIGAVSDSVDIIIAHNTNDSASHRTVPWLQQCFPCVHSVNTRYVNSDQYRAILANWSLEPILANPHTEHAYAVNKPLETGVKLGDIDNHEVNWHLPINITPWPLPYQSYQCLFTSMLGPWKPDKWAALANASGLPTLLLGCSWDAKDAIRVAAHLEQPHTLVIDRKPPEVLHAIQQAALFIGYQSGLSIMADRLGTQQVMIYYDSLRRMLGTWNNPANEGRHHDFCFFDPFDEILASVANR